MNAAHLLRPVHLRTSVEQVARRICKHSFELEALFLEVGDSRHSNGFAFASDTPLPTTLKAALSPSQQCRVITEATPPFRVVHVNTAWEHLCGYSADEVVGKDLRVIQGPLTSTDVLSDLGRAARDKQPIRVMLNNYRKHGEVFRNHLRTMPLTEPDGRVRHMLGVLEEVNSLPLPPSVRLQFQESVHGGHGQRDVLI
mmetsp:Transcript_8756/g.16533  ORF Transcript_8756/g.16533 Transcript_8756/m.16533 type:complete len:198 (-) Transcript_8756:342-935(-)|eukprot:CAMPEP_0114248398 /NCGR_PEP_ID=MMETSP0058-20121206/13554_1 /TAXON_ID=36894 /ORGANISM="Pyramimonas parkeae, CCMP726" /LENGTH=197 /DNA_ID=CAMNT_0001361807 /DNA_START=153 /DNA_END=746 /DNA_ORIENTATION=+